MRESNNIFGFHGGGRNSSADGEMPSATRQITEGVHFSFRGFVLSETKRRGWVYGGGAENE